jgi:hypothetical protein
LTRALYKKKKVIKNDNLKKIEKKKTEDGWLSHPTWPPTPWPVWGG